MWMKYQGKSEKMSIIFSELKYDGEEGTEVP